MNLHFFRIFCLIIFSLMSLPAMASSPSSTVNGSPKAQVAPVVAAPPPTADDMASPNQKQTEALRAYVNPSYINLAKSLWALNVLNLDDDVAVDNFLKISECGLYSRFFKNEFEWQKIRDATRDYLKKYKGTFPRRYEYVQPLMLDRYDFALKGFKLMPSSAFKTSDRLEMAKSLQRSGLCPEVSYDNLKGYPAAMMVLLKQPFSLSFVRVNDDLAQEYLKILADKGADITKGRPAYIRFRMRFDRYVGEDYAGQEKYAVFAGPLETIEVFADRDLMFKLYEQSMN